MMSSNNGVNRREFVTSAVGVSSAVAMASSASAARPSARMIIGANDRINVGFVGVGGRGSSLMRLVLRMAEQRADINVTAVCDVYQKRRRIAQEHSGAEFATLDYHEVLARPDVDAVVVATPDHWHGQIALDALDQGKDVYLEKPMCHTIEEAQKVSEKVKQTKGVLQVGSQTTSSRQ